MPRPGGRGKRGGRAAMLRGGHAQRGKGQRRFDGHRPHSPAGGDERPESAVDGEGEDSESGSGSEGGYFPDHCSIVGLDGNVLGAHIEEQVNIEVPVAMWVGDFSACMRGV